MRLSIKGHLTVIFLIAGIAAVSLIYSRMMTMIATKYIGDFLRQELGEVMGKAMVVKRVSWNPLGRISLHGARLTSLDADGPIPIIEASKIQTDLTVWDIFLKEFRRPLRKIVLVKPRLYFGAKQQSFLKFYNPLDKGRIRRLLLPRLYIQDGEILVLESSRKAVLTLKNISGFIDPTIPVRTRISLRGEPEHHEYKSFNLRGAINLLTLTHDLKLDWLGMRLASLKGFISGVEFTSGEADINLHLERLREFIDPWEGYRGEIIIRHGLAKVTKVATPVKLEGVFKLKGRDFFSERFEAFLGKSKFSGRGKLFLFGAPVIDMDFKSDFLYFEDLMGLSDLTTASGACGEGKLGLKIWGEMNNPEIKGELSFPEVNFFSSRLSDFYASFHGRTERLELERLSMRLCDGYFMASGKWGKEVSLKFDLKEAELQQACNLLAYSKVIMEAPLLSQYCSLARGKVSLSGLLEGPVSSLRLNGFFRGQNIEMLNQSFARVEAEFEWQEGRLKFKPLRIGEGYCLWSDYGYNPPQDLEATLQFNKVKFENLVNNLKLKFLPLTGEVSGEINFKGEPSRIGSKGHLIIERGTISDINFERMDLIFHGQGREIDIEDSSISQEKGKVLTMRGKVFLGEEGRRNMMEIKPSSTGFIWEGWNIEKDAEQMEFNMGRKLAKNWYLNFSTPIDNVHKFPLLEGPPRPDTAEKAELQYNLDEERRLKLRWRDKEEFIGLEQKFKF